MREVQVVLFWSTKMPSLSDALGEALNVLAQALSWLLLAAAQLPLLARVCVRALEVPDED
jgi:hypothetical protein